MWLLASRQVKYLYKYTYKGPDKACLERAVDEVANFLHSRYCGASEAAWPLFGFPMQGRSHHVERLPVHLPLEKNVLFEEGAEAEAAIAALSRDSKLEAWFRLCSSAHTFPDATCALIRSLRYIELPRHFVWEPKSSSWKLRSKTLKELFHSHRRLASNLLDETIDVIVALFMPVQV